MSLILDVIGDASCDYMIPGRLPVVMPETTVAGGFAVVCSFCPEFALESDDVKHRQIFVGRSPNLPFASLRGGYPRGLPDVKHTHTAIQ